MKFLLKKGIASEVYYPYPLHTQKPFTKFSNPLPVTERLTKEILALPLYPKLSETDFKKITDSIGEFYKLAKVKGSWILPGFSE